MASVTLISTVETRIENEEKRVIIIPIVKPKEEPAHDRDEEPGEKFYFHLKYRVVINQFFAIHSGTIESWNPPSEVSASCATIFSPYR